MLKIYINLPSVIRTHDMWITTDSHLQSTALPTEL